MKLSEAPQGQTLSSRQAGSQQDSVQHQPPRQRRETLTTPQIARRLHHRLASDWVPSYTRCKQMTKPGMAGQWAQRKDGGADGSRARSGKQKPGLSQTHIVQTQSSSFFRTLIMSFQETPHCLPGLLPGSPRPVPPGLTSLLLWGAGKQNWWAGPDWQLRLPCPPTSGVGAISAHPHPTHSRPSLAARFQCQIRVTLPLQHAQPGQLTPARPPVQSPECLPLLG